MFPGSKIKEKLIDKIRNTEHEELLSQISRLVDFESQIENVYSLNQEELNAINEGIEQLNKG
jgi:iron-sulfur cluster repair protein YtfE (RIC family)